MGFLDEQFYTDIKSGEKISLRNASSLGVNTTFSNNSISVYNKSTNTHHQISDAFDTEADAIAYMQNFNAQIRDEVVISTASTASHAEHERYEARRLEREQEANNRQKSNSAFLSGDN